MSAARLLIAAALREEIAPITGAGWQAMTPLQVARWPLLCWSVGGGEIIGVATGVGTEACSEALIAVDARLHVDGILSVGYAGAVSEEMEVGDIGVAEQICAAGSAPQIANPAALDVARQVARAWRGRPWRFGVGLTSDKVLPTAEAKTEAARAHGAQWVDMESVAAARLASRFAVPWLAMRAISDRLSDDLNQSFPALCEGGTARAILSIATRPGSVGPALRLRRQCREAAHSLCEAVALLAPRFLEQIAGESNRRTR